MPDVEVRFLGDSGDAVSAAEQLDAVLETIRALAVQVTNALGDIKIGPSVVARFVADAKVMEGALEGIEEQADDTRRSLSLISMAAMGGPAGTMLASAMRGIPFVGYPGARDQGPFASPLTGVQSNQQAASRTTISRVLGANDPETNPGVAAALAYLGGRSTVSGGSDAIGLLAAMGWGGGSGRFGRVGRGFGGFGVPFLRGATPGSLLGLAGLGTERIAGMTLGIGGSMLGGVLGGGLYGLGILGTGAVGMGTDMAGIGQAVGDIRKTTQAYAALQQAVAQYGKNSQQARNAQAQLNLTLQGFSPVARAAVMQATLTGQQFKAMFDRFTGPAEKTGAQVVNQGMQVGESFLPTLGKYASENMKIIQKGLQPLFTWTQSPGGGLGIFTQLEQLFQNRLPTAVHAGTQAFEVFSHAVLDAANRTGGFLPKVDEFLTKLNTPAGLASMDKTIGSLMGLFHTWLDLLVSVGKVIYDVFRPAVGLGADFAKQLTSIVNLTGQWLSAAGTKDVLHNLFQAHKQQLDAIFSVIRALWPILEQTISAFLQVEAVITRLTIGPLKALAGIIHAITQFPFADKIIGWGLALLFIVKVGGPLGLMIGNFRLLQTVLMAFVTRIPLIGGAFATAATETTAATATMDADLASVGTAATVAGAKGAAGFTAMLGPIAWATAAIYGLDKAIKALTGFDALSKAWGSAGWFADNTSVGHRTGKNPYPTGDTFGNEHLDWQMGYTDKKPKWMSESDYHALQKTAAYKQGVKARKKADSATGNHGTNTSQGGYANPVAANSSFARVDQGVDYSVNGSVSAIASGSIISVGGGMAGGTGAIIKQRFDKPVYVNGRVYYGAYYSEGKPLVSKGDHVKAGEPVMGGGGVELGFLLGPDLVFPPLKGGLGAGTKPGQSGYDFEQFAGGLGAPMGGALPPNATYTSPAANAYAHAAGLPGSTRHASSAPALATAASIIQARTDAARVLASIRQGLSLRYLEGGAAISPANIMGVHTLTTARAKIDPELKAWRAEIDKLEKRLHSGLLTSTAEHNIVAQMDRIQQKVSGALSKLRQAAQTQLQAASTAWSSFMQAFDTSYSGANSNSTQLDAARTQLGQDQLAVSADAAQSAILGGTADTSMAQKVINDMKTVLASPGGTPQPYTQAQIDNWLALWGDYYAKQGYTPQQMYDAFNKLLASVGLPTIDNPFDTGGLPLPPGSGGSSSGPSTAPMGIDAIVAGLGGAPVQMPNLASRAAARTTIRSQQSVSRLSAVTQTVTHSAHDKRPIHVEVRLEKGLEWLDKHVTVIVDGEIQKQGDKANKRARSGAF